MKNHLPFLFLGALLLCGCGSDPDPKPTITQGVWGRLIAGCDTPDCDSQPIEKATVNAVPINGNMNPGGSATTNQDGLYQIELQPGDYHLARSTGSVSETDVTVGIGLVECTWISGPGGGNWNCQ